MFFTTSVETQQRQHLSGKDMHKMRIKGRKKNNLPNKAEMKMKSFMLDDVNFQWFFVREVKEDIAYQ